MLPSMAISDDNVSDAALDPKRVKTDAAEVEARSIDELLKAKAALAGSTASGKAHRGIRFTQLLPADVD